MGDLSKVYPVQSIARSNCDPRIPLGYAGGQYAMGAEYRRLALAAVVAVVFCEAQLQNTNYLSRAQRLAENFSLSQKNSREGCAHRYSTSELYMLLDLYMITQCTHLVRSALR